MKELVIFSDKYTQLDKMLLEAVHSEGIAVQMYYLQDEPYGTTGCMSIYEQYLYRYEAQEPVEKDLYYIFMEVPEFWEIQSVGFNGAIIHQGNEQAVVYFREPREKRIVQRVEWKNADGKVYKVDYYGRYGRAYCTEYRNHEGIGISKVYYTSEKEEIINVNLSNGSVILNHEGRVYKMFPSVKELENYLMQDLIAAADAVAVTSYELQHRLQLLLNQQKEPVRILYSRAEYPQVAGNAQAFILTSSDRMYGISRLVEGLPQVHFHLAARTNVSDYMRGLGNIANITVYPGIREEKIEELLQKCDFYLDINSGREVEDIIRRAAMENLLILGIENRVHNPEYMLKESIYEEDELEKMLEKINYLSSHKEELQALCVKQQEKAKSTIRAIMEK